MGDIRPFPGIRYNTLQQQDLSSKIAPPYDVLSDADKQTLLGRDPHNFVTLDLPHTPPKAAGPPEAYAGARQALDQWLSGGVLVQDDTPGLYVYHQRYKVAGQALTRKMYFARLRLEPFGEGSVYPHEQTFGGPKEDRLALTKACVANLSPIFGLYPDAQNQVATTLDRVCQVDPLATATLDGIENALWVVNDAGLIGDVQQQMADKPVFIADGHHRYGTGLLYRQWAAEQRGPLSDDDPANFVLCVLCAMEDPGLQILPTHRVLPEFTVTDEIFDKDDKVAVQELPVGTPEELQQALAELGPQALGVYAHDLGHYLAVRPVEPTILDDVTPDRSEAFRRLGLAFLHAYLLDKLVRPELPAGQSADIRYIKSAADAIQAADDTRGTAFLLQPTTMEELQRVCQAGDLMPQKSTFFYPKLASGLVINPLS